MTYVIAGAGPAGVIAAETLRKTNPDSEIMLIGDEPEPPYSRMAIPYFMAGNIKEAGTHLRKSNNHYDDRKIKYVQDRVESVKPQDGKLTLQGGEKQAFDQLLVATGASAVKPPVSGLDLPGVHHCWTLEDSREIVKLAKKDANVVLMGAGFIGCIILQALVECGVKLTVVEMEDRMVPRMMNDTAGNMLKRWCEKKGIVVYTSTRATEVSEQDGEGGATLSVALDNGKNIPAHLVVVATGVASNTEFLDGSGVKVEEGVVVDKHLKSSADNVYAAGDCAQGPDFSGGWSVHAIQPTAADHGRIAALNMAGHAAAYKGSLVMNVLDTAGLISTSFGQWQGVEGGDIAEALDDDNFRYMQLAFDGDCIIGALSVGRTDHVGVMRGLIQSRLALGDWKRRLMQDPNRIMDAYLASAYV